MKKKTQQKENRNKKIKNRLLRAVRAVPVKQKKLPNNN